MHPVVQTSSSIIPTKYLYLLRSEEEGEEEGVKFTSLGDNSGSAQFIPVRETPKYDATPPSFHTTPPAIEFIPTRDPNQDNGSQPGKFKISIENVDFLPTPSPPQPTQQTTTTTPVTTTITTATTTTASTRRTTTRLRTARPNEIVEIYNQVTGERERTHEKEMNRKKEVFNTVNYDEDEISNEIITTGSADRFPHQVR